MDTPQALAKYIQDVTGVSPVLGSIPKSRLAGLQMYLAKAFDIRRLEIFGHSVLVAIVTSEAPLDLAQLAKHRELLAARLGEEVVLTLPGLKSYERRRLIQKGIPFIAPGKQMYLPMILVDLRESFSTGAQTTNESLSWVAQVIVLRHLLSGDIECRSMADVAFLLGYSAMAVSHAMAELVAFRLCRRVQQGRSKFIRFESDPDTLWPSALPLMRSPVKKIHLVREYDPTIVRPQQAGMTALAELTTITDGPIKTLALGTKDFRSGIDGGHIETCPLAEDAEAVLQAWAYVPKRLSMGQAVDPLSLYLSLRDDPDERVQIAMEQLVETWK
jgi:hypothetical protein